MSTEQVQVEARTLSGVHLGKTVTIANWMAGTFTGRPVRVEHDAAAGVVVFFDGAVNGARLAPTDLVTLTDGGASG